MLGRCGDQELWRYNIWSGIKEIFFFKNLKMILNLYRWHRSSTVYNVNIRYLYKYIPVLKKADFQKITIFLSSSLFSVKKQHWCDIFSHNIFRVCLFSQDFGQLIRRYRQVNNYCLQYTIYFQVIRKPWCNYKLEMMKNNFYIFIV